MRKTKNKTTRLIVAASEHDADMLYATKFFAQDLVANKIHLRATNGLFWPEREAKSDKEIEMIGRALRITEIGLARAVEILKGSKPGTRKQLRWSGKTLTSEILRAEIDSAIL